MEDKREQLAIPYYMFFENRNFAARVGLRLLRKMSVLTRAELPGTNIDGYESVQVRCEIEIEG